MLRMKLNDVWFEDMSSGYSLYIETREKSWFLVFGLSSCET